MELPAPTHHYRDVHINSSPNPLHINIKSHQHDKQSLQPSQPSQPSSVTHQHTSQPTSQPKSIVFDTNVLVPVKSTSTHSHSPKISPINHHQHHHHHDHHVHAHDHSHHHHHHHHHDHHHHSGHSHSVGGSPSLQRRSFWNIRCTCIFSALPDEILLFDVFSFLDTTALCTIANVCTRWRFLSSDQILWKRLDLSSHAKSMTDAVGASLLSRFGEYLEIFKLCNCTKMSTAFLRTLGSFLHSLRELHLCNLRTLDDIGVIEISKHCPDIEHLSLFGCINVTDVAMIEVGNAMTRMEELSVRGCVKLTGLTLQHLPHSLKGLNLAGCRSITADALSALATRAPKLERLNLHGIPVTDISFDRVTRGCIQLTTLHISSANPFGGNPMLSDSALFYLARCTQLVCLNLQGACNISDSALHHLTTHCTLLERLNLGGCYRITDVGVTRITTSAPKLTHLSLFQCFNLTDHGVYEISTRLSSLQHLDLHSCVGLTCTSLDHMMDASTRLPSLQSLDIGSCRNISMEHVNVLKIARPGVNVIYY